MIDIAIIRPGYALLWNWPKRQQTLVVVKNVTADGKVEALLPQGGQATALPASLNYVPGVEYAPATEPEAAPVKKPRKPRAKKASADGGAVPVASH